MTRSQNTKRALVFSVISLMLCLSLLLGTTFAWFTDSVTNSGNQIQAGTLEISMDNTTTPLFSSANSKWEPGYSEKKEVTLQNAGNLWLKYTLRFTNVKTEGGTVDPNADITEVLDVYKVAATATDLAGATPLGTVKDLMSATPGELTGILAPKDGQGTVDGIEVDSTDSFTLVIKMQESADNDYQGARVSFDVEVLATQYTYEKDGFDNNQYDAEAPLNFETVEAGENATDNGNKLRSALINAPEEAVVYLEKGTYEMNETLVLTKPVRIVGEEGTVLDFSSAQAPDEGGYNTSAGLLVLASDVTVEGVTVYGNSGLNAIATVGIDNAGAAGLDDNNIKVSDTINYDFEWAVNEFAPDYKNVYENVNFVNCTFALKDAASIAHGLFLESRYTVVDNCTFRNIQAGNAVVKIEEDHVKVLGSTFENCTGNQILEYWCGASGDGDGNEYPGHPFKCQEGWNNLKDEAYQAHLDYAASKGWNHSPEIPTEVTGDTNLGTAIADAQPGATLQLAAATYAGPLTIDKPLTIEGTEGTKITGFIAVNAEDVTLKNIDMDVAVGTTSNVTSPIQTNNQSLTLEDCKITRTTNTAQPYGMLVNVGTGTLTARNVVFTAPCAGDLFEASPSVIEAGEVYLDGCEIRTDGYGLFSQHVTKGLIQNTRFTGIDGRPTLGCFNSTLLNGLVFDHCTFDMGENSIIAAGSFTIRNSTFDFTNTPDNGAGNGINLYSTSGPVVLEENTFILKDGKTGINLTSASWAEGDHDANQVTIAGNRFEGTGSAAIKASSLWTNVNTESLTTENQLNGNPIIVSQ